MKTADKDAKYLVRDSGEAVGIDVVRTLGSFVIDSAGRKYVDFAMGWCVGNLGWGNVQIRKRLRAYAGPEYVNPAFRHRGWADLAELLVSVAPGKLRKCVRTTGGTEAVEAALLAAMAYTGRSGFISLQDSYHGNSVGARSVGASDERKQFKNLLPHCHKINPPLDRKAAEKVGTLLKRKDIAAFVMEPVVCNLGVVVPDADFLPRVQHLCRKYGTLLVMDEVATGFGRTGPLFACEHFGVEPDALCVAKAITGGHGPLGATLVTDKVARALSGAGFYSTYGWHPWSVEAALVTVRHHVHHRRAIERNTRLMGAYFEARLSAMKFASRAKVRVKGLAIAVELDVPGHATALAARALKEGVIVSPLDEKTVVLFPALTIDERTAKLGLDRLERVAG